jgi:hypothetical protein
MARQTAPAAGGRRGRRGTPPVRARRAIRRARLLHADVGAPVRAGSSPGPPSARSDTKAGTAPTLATSRSTDGLTFEHLFCTVDCRTDVRSSGVADGNVQRDAHTGACRCGCSTAGRAHSAWRTSDLPVINIDQVRDELAAYPVARGPRRIFDVRTPDARLRLAFEQRRPALAARGTRGGLTMRRRAGGGRATI